MTDKRRRCEARDKEGHRCNQMAGHDGKHRAFKAEF